MQYLIIYFYKNNNNSNLENQVKSKTNKWFKKERKGRNVLDTEILKKKKEKNGNEIKISNI